jgi:tetratricopeptide (TPR) repeat protein
VTTIEQSLPQHVLERMGHLAMQQGRFEQARSLYRCILANNDKAQKSVDVNDGDIWHAIAASYLGQGHFLKAQQIWREAHEQHCPTNEAISLQVQKYNAYHHWNNGNNKSWCNNNQQDAKILISKSTTIPNFLTLLEGQCFVTAPDSPLLSEEECQMVIQWAEQEATLRQGWTTSRHYAVPTTDLPIHEMTDTVLPWFRQLWKYRLGPLMERQFGTATVGSDGSHLYVHDAFCVRYNSNEQRHLPLHRDESTHSFVLALNNGEEYEGGGTYIADLGTSIRPGIGGVVSFRGDSLLHGGDPVVSGTRYIIVAFLYLDQGSHDRSDPSSTSFDRNYSPNEESFPSSNDFDCKAPPSKKSKKFSFSRTKNDEDDDNTTENNTGSFSFGFQL